MSGVEVKFDQYTVRRVGDRVWVQEGDMFLYSAPNWTDALKWTAAALNAQSTKIQEPEGAHDGD